MNHLIISFVGQDKLGLVDKLSNLIHAHQGNWQNSSLHHLAGTFAGVIEVSIHPDHINALDAALMKFEDLNVITAMTQPITEQASNTQLTLELTANDRSGIIQDISSVIHQQGGNLIKLVSKQGAAPHTGQIMFNAKAQVTVMENRIDALIEALECIEDDLMVDISR